MIFFLNDRIKLSFGGFPFFISLHPNRKEEIKKKYHSKAGKIKGNFFMTISILKIHDLIKGS